jgi:YVTN family beta-propeller protein
MHIYSPSIAGSLVFFAASMPKNLVTAVNSGDQQYGNLNGLFYTFSKTNGVVSMIDPISASIKNSISLGNTINWGDSVYIRDQAQIKHYLFSGDSDNDIMYVIDTTIQKIISKVKMGDKPLHVYAVPARDEVWVHLDNAGMFDVFHMSQVRYRTSSGVTASTGSAGHGKLLTDASLEDTAYSTNIYEGGLGKLKLSTREQIAQISLSLPGAPINCTTGTHGIAFNSQNDRIYAECTNPPTCVAPYSDSSICTGSIWGISSATGSVIARLVSPTLSIRFAVTDFGINGAPYSSPEDSFVLIPSKRYGLLTILKPTSGSTAILEIPMSLSPGTIVFWVYTYILITLSICDCLPLSHV